jgi:hypothetical protein
MRQKNIDKWLRDNASRVRTMRPSEIAKTATKELGGDVGYMFVTRRCRALGLDWRTS